MIVFKNFASKEFIEQYIPAIMYRKAIQLTNEPRVKVMNEYLKENYKITILDVIRQVSRKFEINYNDDSTILKLNNNTLEEKSQVKLSALVRLINDGNTEVKGTRILSKVKEYIHDNIQVIYSTYLYGKEREDVS